MLQVLFVCLFGFFLLVYVVFVYACVCLKLTDAAGQLASFSLGLSSPPEHWDYRWAVMSPSFYVGAGTQLRSSCLHDEHFLKIILKQ